MGARAELSLVLIAGSLVLVLAILIGNNMGNRVIASLAHRPSSFSTTPVPIATPTPADPGSVESKGRRHEAIAVATDPGFPDPRVTPEPPPPETPRPRPKKTPTPEPSAIETPGDDLYSSPPLPLPIVSHDSVESPAAGDSPSAEPPPAATGAPRPQPATAAPRPPPGRGYPTLPPVSYPSAGPGG